MANPSRKIRLVSTALHGYAGRLIYAGQEFEVDERDVEELVMQKKARYPKPIAPKAFVAEKRTNNTPSKRRYRRRDMEAES